MHGIQLALAAALTSRNPTICLAQPAVCTYMQIWGRDRVGSVSVVYLGTLAIVWPGYARPRQKKLTATSRSTLFRASGSAIGKDSAKAAFDETLWFRRFLHFSEYHPFHGLRVGYRNATFPRLSTEAHPAEKLITKPRYWCDLNTSATL